MINEFINSLDERQIEFAAFVGLFFAGAYTLHSYIGTDKEIIEDIEIEEGINELGNEKG